MGGGAHVVDRGPIYRVYALLVVEFGAGWGW